MARMTQINNLRSVINLMNRLPKEVDETMRIEAKREIAKNLQRRIKRRAPKGPTGWLRRSVMIEKYGKITRVIVHARYAQAIEEGRSSNKRTPGRYVIPIEFFDQHYTRPESPGEWVSNPKGFVDLQNSRAVKPRPFFNPAYNSWLPQVDRLLTQYIEKALNKANQGA